MDASPEKQTCRRKSTVTALNSLGKHWEWSPRRSIAELFDDDSGRQHKFSLEAEGLLFDYSKTNIDDVIMECLQDMAMEADLRAMTEALFCGESINKSEGRAALHTALRASPRSAAKDVGPDIAAGIGRTLQRMRALSEGIRSGGVAPEPGLKFTDIVNIGIGGSDLGPAMAVEALEPYADGPTIHFVSNVDSAQISGVLRRINPRTSMFVVASKTFRTIETLTNSRTARAWIESKLGQEAVRSRFLAVSANLGEAAAFGIDQDMFLGFEDWVGGRYSLWGPVGIPLMIAIGPKRFDEFLKGAWSMDGHFRNSPYCWNIPALLSMVGLFHNQVCGYGSRAILPYDQRLAKLPAYLQQLEMESNGKSVSVSGKPVRKHSAPVIWGSPGTNGQHAFHQMLHQGTRTVPCEFLVGASGHEPDLEHHHDILVANCLAQAAALMQGTPEGTESHRACRGNRPSTVLVYPKLTPYVLGQIIALYEHRVFTEGAILGINSFDQWGVELGKELATGLLECISNGDVCKSADGSTRMLMDFIGRARRRHQ